MEDKLFQELYKKPLENKKYVLDFNKRFFEINHFNESNASINFHLLNDIINIEIPDFSCDGDVFDRIFLIKLLNKLISKIIEK